MLAETALRARSAKVETGFASDRAPNISERIIFSPNRQHFGGLCAGHAGIRYRVRTRGRNLQIHRNHANPPRFERQSTAYKCITGVLQYAGASASAFVIALMPRASWHARHQPFPELQTQQPQAERCLQRRRRNRQIPGLLDAKTRPGRKPDQRQPVHDQARAGA